MNDWGWKQTEIPMMNLTSEEVQFVVRLTEIAPKEGAWNDKISFLVGQVIRLRCNGVEWEKTKL